MDKLLSPNSNNKAMVLLKGSVVVDLMFYVPPIVCGGFLCWSLFWYAILYVLFNFAIILARKRELVALLLLSSRCFFAVNVPWLFLTAPWVTVSVVCDYGISALSYSQE